MSQYPLPVERFFVNYSFTGTNIREEYDNDRDAIYAALEDVANSFVNATEDEVTVDDEGDYFDAVAFALSVDEGVDDYIDFPGNDLFQPLTLRFT